MGLPATPKKMALMRRNFYLAEAAQQIDCESSWQGAVILASELDKFLSRGNWRSWRELAAPPPEASRLRAALFHVAKAHAGRQLSPKQVDRIVGHVFAQKCRSDSANI